MDWKRLTILVQWKNQPVAEVEMDEDEEIFEAVKWALAASNERMKGLYATVKNKWINLHSTPWCNGTVDGDTVKVHPRLINGNYTADKEKLWHST
jgi:hypothetical protein